MHPKQQVEHISSALDDLVAQCTQMEEKDRPPNAKQIKEVLAKLQHQNKDMEATKIG